MDYSQYIRDAIISGRVLRVSYSDLNQPQVNAIIRPLSWEDPQRFKAQNVATGDEWVFDVRGIQYCQSFASLEQAREYEKRAELDSLPPPVVVPRPASTGPYRARSNIPSWLQIRTNRAQATKIIRNSIEWHRLLAYYSRCIEQSWFRQLVIHPNQLHAFILGDDLLGQFFNSKIGLGFVKNQQAPEISTQFFNEIVERPSAQLCLGYPYIFLRFDRAAPLVYTRVSMIQDGDQIVLQSGKVEVSAAAARYLQVPVEEIEALLDPEGGGGALVPARLVDYVQGKFGREYTILNHLTDAVGAKSIFQKPAMFWADSDQAENGLIRSLGIIGNEAYWLSVPDVLKGLFSGVSEPVHPGSNTVSEWEFFAVTPDAYESRAAVEAGLIGPLSVAVAPESQQRSDLVLNLTVQSFLAGHSVLIACRSVDTADLAFRRLIQETGFQGAVRIGKWTPIENKILTARQGLEIAGSRTAADWGIELQNLHKSRHEYLHADFIIERIHSLDGMKSVFLQQRDRLFPSLIDPWKGMSRRVLTHEGMQDLLSELSELFNAASDQNDRLAGIQFQIQELIIENTSGFAVIEDLKAWERQMSPSGSGLVFTNIPAAIAPLRDFIQTWVWLVSINNIRYQQAETQQSLAETREQIDELSGKLWPGLSQKIEPLAVRHTENVMTELSDRFQQLAVQFEALAERKPGLTEQLSVVSPLLTPMEKAVKAFDFEIHKLGLSWPPRSRVEVVGAAAYAQAAGQMRDFSQAVACRQRIDRLVELSKQLDIQSQTVYRNLPAAVQNFMENYSAAHPDSGKLSQTFDQVLADLAQLEIETVELINRIHANLEKNQLGLGVLSELWALDEAGQAGMRPKTTLPDPQVLVDYLDAWANLARVLQLNGLIQDVEMQLASLPSEADALRLKEEPPQRLVELNRKIFSGSWLERTARLNQETRQNALDFLGELERQSQLRDESSPAFLSPAADAVRIFPVWVGTEAEARMALPLIPGLFDLLIVDEADQIDLAKALPLMCRAKRAAVIGSAVAFRGAAWMDTAEDLALAKENGIDTEVFSFKRHSLLDLAQHRLGKQAEPMVVGPAASAEELSPGVVQMRHTSQLNLLACLDSSREFIWWIDPDFNNDLVNLFWDRLQEDRMLAVNEIRIIAAAERMKTPEDANQELHMNSLKALQAEMDDFGIHFEVRFLAKASFPEKRFFFSENQAIEMPAFPEVYRDRHLLKNFTQVAETGRELFMQYWDLAEPLNAPSV